MNGKKKKILIVDDEKAISEMVSEFCKSFGFDTKVLSSGHSILEQVRAYKPNLILLDLLMPGLSGIQVIKVLKEHEDTKHIPVMILSVAADSEEAKEILELCECVLAKPVTAEILKEKLQTVLSA